MTSDLRARLLAMADEMQGIAIAAGQCSVEGPEGTESQMAAAEAERAGRWAHQLREAATRVPEGRREDDMDEREFTPEECAAIKADYEAWLGKRGMPQRVIAQLQTDRAALTGERDRLREALEPLVIACEKDAAGPTTDVFGDNESVGGGSDNTIMALTFGMIRRGRAALASSAVPTEREILIADRRDASLLRELRAYLNTVTITSDTIGDIRRSLFFPWDSPWNAWVRDETATRENKPPAASASPEGQE